ncbi:response regulator [Desulfoplanes sp.]
MPSKEKKTVMIADDHEIVREGLRNLLAMFGEFELVGEASDGVEAVSFFDELRPDILLLDLSMPGCNGALTTKKIIGAHPKAKILILTAHYADEYLYSTLEAGAMGYILKDQPSDDLIEAMDTVLKGNPYLSPKVSTHLITNFVTSKHVKSFKESFSALTTREREILTLIAGGKTSKDISELLHISVKTVEKHRANVLKKTGKHNGPELTNYAIEHGLVIRQKQLAMDR